MNRNIKKLAFFLMGISLFQACDNDGVTGESDEFNTGRDLPMFAAELTRPGAVAGNRLIDISTGEVFTSADAESIPEKMDFIMLWGSSSGLNFISPSDIGRLSEWASGRTMNETYLTKNETTFVKIGASAETDALYEGLISQDQVKALYESTLQELEADEANDERVYGPSISLRMLEEGDLVLAKTSDGVYGALQLSTVVASSTGSITLSIRLDNREETPVTPVDEVNRLFAYEAELSRPGYANAQRYIDFSTGNTYQFGSSIVAPLENDGFLFQEKIDMLFYNASSTGYTIMSPSESSVTGWDSGDYVATGWLQRNATEFIRLKASEITDSLYMYTYNKELMRKAYDYATQAVTEQEDYSQAADGPGTRIRTIENAGDLILFKSVDRNTYGMMLLTEVTSGGAGKLAFEVKVDKSEEVVIPAPPKRYLELNGVGTSTADFIDFSTGRILLVGEAELESENIDVAHLRGSNTNHNFISIAQGDNGFGAWSVAFRQRIEDFPTNNKAEMVNLGDVATTTWKDLDQNNRQDYIDAFESGVGAPVLHDDDDDGRLTQLAAGDIVIMKIFRLEGVRYVAVRVMAADNDGGMTIRYKLSPAE
ncbi:hypothetical protein [Sinomicrobium sp.]